MFFTLFGHGCRVPGWGGSPRGFVHNMLRRFHPRPLKKRRFRNLFFPYCEHLICPSKVCEACLRHHSCVFHLIWDHYTATLYNKGVVPTRHNMTQKTLRVPSSHQCTKKVCVYSAGTVWKQSILHACIDTFPHFSVPAVHGVQSTRAAGRAVGGRQWGSADVQS